MVVYKLDEEGDLNIIFLVMIEHKIIMIDHFIYEIKKWKKYITPYNSTQPTKTQCQYCYQEEAQFHYHIYSVSFIASLKDLLKTPLYKKCDEKCFFSNFNKFCTSKVEMTQLLHLLWIFSPKTLFCWKTTLKKRHQERELCMLFQSFCYSIPVVCVQHT